jgi:hypothetical protein
MNQKQHCLIGKTITALQMSGDQGALRFVLADGEVVARADGDCCSHTWIEDVELPALGFPATVLAVEDIDLPKEMQVKTKTGHDEEEMAYYGCKITTDRGDLVIAYRNSSNGYYGGSLAWPGDYFCGGVGGQNGATEGWQDVAP